MDKFWFDGECSYDKGIYISSDSIFNAPEREVEVVSIEGRNGNLIIDKGKYKNINIAYSCFIRENFSSLAANIRDFLCSKIGYKRLEDTYNPNHYRLARFSGGINFDVHFLKAGEFNLAFECKPQRFLKSGDYSINIQKGDVINNLTSFPSKPLIKAYGTGSAILQVGDIPIKINEIDNSLTIDCDTQNAYKDTENKNSTINASEFPSLLKGKTGITWSGGITKLEVTPRWWTL